MPKQYRDFLETETLHYATISWWWTDKSLHDIDYHIKVSDSMNAKAQELCLAYDIDTNTGFCCQFEGVQLVGLSQEAVQAAGAELAKHLMRWREIRSL